jgi:hypothetical protein
MLSLSGFAGRVVILAALFAVVGAVDWGIQSRFDEVAPATVWIAVIVSSPPVNSHP